MTTALAPQPEKDVHVPLRASDSFDAARRFAAEASDVLAARNPDLLTTQQRRADRGDRIYADVMRNAYAQTVVAPYSVRARPGGDDVVRSCTGTHKGLAQI